MNNLFRRFQRKIANVAVAADPGQESVFFMPPGHFYSPVPSLQYVQTHADRIFGTLPTSIPGIDLRGEEQLALLRQLKSSYDTQPFSAEKTPGFRYHFNNQSYAWNDGLLLHGMLRQHRPARIIEIGSGYSTAMMLDTRDRFLDGKLELTCIEPYPQLLHSLLLPGDADRMTIIASDVQDVDLTLFDQLQENDILFIDSTHVGKIGSDVNFEFFEILPRLRPGVLIHIHDVFYPFEYPYDWIMQNRGWNELYLLRTFLQFNSAFRIELFSSWLMNFHEDVMRELMPLSLNNAGGNIWLKRVA